MQLAERTEQAIIYNAEMTFLELRNEFLQLKDNTNTKEKLIELCKHFSNEVDYALTCCEVENMFNFMYKNLQATIDFNEQSNEIVLCGSVDVRYGENDWLDNVEMENVI